MQKKLLLVALLAIALATSANALTNVRDLNVSVLNNGAGFLGVGDENIAFMLYDNNAGIMVGKVTYIAKFWYGTSKGAETTSIADVNLGVFGVNSGYCPTLGSTDANVIVGKKCQYTWTATAIDSIADGNYYIDVNVVAMFDVNTTNTTTNITRYMYDANMDTNASFYIDNTSPTCEVQAKRGNDIEWIITDAASSQGSLPTLYYSAVKENKTPEYSNTALTGGVLAGTASTGTYDYTCYASDTAGNSGTTSSTKTITYPVEGGMVVVGGGGGAAATAGAIAGVQSIATDFAANPVGTMVANPLPFVILAVAGYLLFFSGKKARGKRKRR